jgi:hypothetical protein
VPRHLAVAVLLVGACASTGRPQEGRLASNAPRDRPVRVAAQSPEEAHAKLQALIAPYVAEARATYPEAKRRYLAGLAPGETFFVTCVLRDGAGLFEQVFLLVDHIEAGVITGRIWSEIETVHEFRRGDAHRVTEGEIVDWLISEPDGTEQGNFVGKFLDTLPQLIRD